MIEPKLPVGWTTFHPVPFIDYQFNRWHGCGFAEAHELREAAQGTRRGTEVRQALSELSRRAESQGRLCNAAAYQRGAEFFTPHHSAERVAEYRRFRELFDRGFAEAGFRRHEVPYAGGHLPAYHLPSLTAPARGTVLVHGGFDSLIEEFYVVWERIAAAGFEVVAFDGPGQGGALALGRLHFDHDWEKPVGAVLDHFSLEEADLVGISMGGYWALRAAGREPRIRRVVAWPPVFDWTYRAPAFLRPVVHALVRFRGFMNWGIRLRMRLFPVLHHAVHQAVYLVGGNEPMDAVDWLMGMNHQHLGSERVTQDVLLMAGERDTFQPPKLAAYQADALVHARSVTQRVFTAAEHAGSHCQIDHLDLACSVLTTWLRTGEVSCEKAA